LVKKVVITLYNDDDMDR